jgi:WD40 repeat protein
VTDTSFSPDGKRIATASRDGTAALWKRGGQLIRTLQHEAPVLDLEFSPNRPLLVTATSKGTVHIWGLNDRSHTVIRAPAPAEITISKDGELMVVYGADRVARIYRLPTG